MGTAIIDITKQVAPSETTDARSTTEPCTGERLSSPVTEEAYDVLAALHAKLEGIHACRGYAHDADAKWWSELDAMDHAAVCKLGERLEQMFREGKFWQTDSDHG